MSFRRCFSLLIFAIVLACVASEGFAQVPAEAPLLPGEEFARYKNDCILIWTPLPGGNSPIQISARKASLANATWAGGCERGLVSGPQNVNIVDSAGTVIAHSTYQYLLGRRTSIYDRVGLTPTSLVWRRHELRAPDGTWRTAMYTAKSSPFDQPEFSPTPGKPVTILIGDDNVSVTTFGFSCMTAFKMFGAGGDPKKTKPDQYLRGCKETSDYTVYGVKVDASSIANPILPTATFCPDPRSFANCIAVWDSVAGPMKLRLRAFISDVERADAELAVRYTERLLTWEREKAAAEIAVLERAARKADSIADLGKFRADSINAVAQQQALAQSVAETQFREKLLALNPGELFGLSDQMRTAGKVEQSRDALRALLARFPDHALAVTAAQLMSTLSANTAQAGGAAPVRVNPVAANPAISLPPLSVAASTPVTLEYVPSFESTCDRNFAKVNEYASTSGEQNGGATGDLWVRDVNRDLANILAPCVASSQTARDDHATAMQTVTSTNDLCAAPHPASQCTQWGSSAEMNQRWYAVFKGEVNKALSNPNGYSTDYGSAPGSPASATLNSLVSSSCKQAWDLDDDDIITIQIRKPPNIDLLPELQGTLYILARRMALLDKQCKGDRRYNWYTGFRASYDQAVITCQAMVTDPSSCVPKLVW